MLIDLDTLVKKYGVESQGATHIGAHLLEERDAYKKHFEKVFWIEGQPDTAAKAKEMFPDESIIHALCSDEAGKMVEFNIANNGQSSSILELGTHKEAHPEVWYTDKIVLETTTVDELYESWRLPATGFLNIDVQGAELLVLKGATKYLKHVNYIYLEVNKERLYKDCALVGELDAFLDNYTRVETEWTQFGWGDGFWIRNDVL